MDNLQALVFIINAALEHVPQHTRQMLLESAQPHLKAIEGKLKPAAPPTADG